MRIIFVIGMSSAGKSTYIKNNYMTDKTKVIDLYDFQKAKPFLNYETCLEAYEECKNALIESILSNEYDIVVLEHTMLKAIRRKVYIDAIKEITNTPIEVVLLNKPSEVIANRRIKRFDIDEKYKDREISNIENEKKVLEYPTFEEGFDNILILE